MVLMFLGAQDISVAYLMFGTKLGLQCNSNKSNGMEIIDCLTYEAETAAEVNSLCVIATSLAILISE